MKVCILTPRFPFPENGGDVLRINNIARNLKEQGHQLILVSFYEGNADIHLAQKLYSKVYLIKRTFWESAINSLVFLLKRKPIQCGYYYSHKFKSAFAKITKEEVPDLYISHLLRMTSYLEGKSLQDVSIIEMTDALSKTYALAKDAKGSSLKKIIYKIEKKLIEKYEQHVIATFPKVVLVSQEDYIFLKAKTKQNNSLCVRTNGVNLYPKCLKYDKNKICFIGNMRTLQNQDAVLYFVKEILPIIRSKNNDVKFYIIGAEPSREIPELGKNDKNIIVTGFVNDLYKEACDSCLAIAPVRVASGIQNKVLVSMAMGIPIILSELISKSIPELQNGENCYICKESKDYANKCLSIMSDMGLRDKLSNNGYELVAKYYSWQEKLKDYIL